MPELPATSDVPTLLIRVVDALERIEGAIQTPETEGLKPEDAARFLGISTAKLHAMNGSGELGPMAAMLGVGCCPRYARRELAAWLLSGAPPRVTWRQMREQAIRKAG